ncbi:MAG: PSD1 and planctomycete cytochrome C domain-containing protein [Planctomycetota bacterium]
MSKLNSNRVVSTTLGLFACWSLLSIHQHAFGVDEPTRDQVEFFESKVRPLLVEHCYECHSVDAEEVEAGLLLDSKWGWETGGDSGPAIIPGDVDGSLLIEAVRYEENVVSGMPPRDKLSDSEIQVFVDWIEMGAPDPRAKATPKTGQLEVFDLQSRVEDHWSWRSVVRPQTPSVRDTGWPANEIDRFVLAAMDEAGLMPALDADKRLWLRRVYFDLIGLPPTIAQVNAFLNDDTPEAFERVVDELLKSPHFGEKWARHWMDLVRYAETYGHEFDYPIHHASEYRDYLIRAFNADVPFDQFAREHVAGDLLPEPRRHPELAFNESIIGTGFWYFHEATHAPTDVLGNEADIVDNQLDVFGKTFLGLTISCARCHDHKFDAISTADYYALSAHLQSSCRQEIALDERGQVEQLSTDIEQLRRRIARTTQKVGWETEVSLRPGEYYQAAAELLRTVEGNRPVWQVDPGKVSDEAVTAASEKYGLESDRLRSWVTAFRSIQRAIGHRDAGFDGDQLVNFESTPLPSGWTTSGQAFQPVGSQLTMTAEGLVAKPGIVASGLNGKKQTGILRSPTFELTGKQIHIRMRSDANLKIRLVVDNYYMAHFNALLFRGTFLNGKSTDTGGAWVWKTLGGDTRKYVGHRGYLEFIDNGEGSMAIDRIVISDGGPPREVIDALPSHAAFADQQWRNAIADLRNGKSSELVSAMFEGGLLSIEDMNPLAVRWQRELSELANRLPRPRLVIAMAQGTSENANVYIRGSHNNLGEEVPPRFLQALGGREGDRLSLANQVANPQNPLTARVAVNRLWHHLFGCGIVASVDDFGPQGQAPTHPELLDWLAAEFVEDGWSIKRMLRKITLSRTYRQASQKHPDLSAETVAAVDPTNQWLHRMPVRRLPAESIRDAILVVSGTLDARQFGPSIATHRTAFMTGRGARASGPLDGARRRSIYLSIYRNFLNPFMLIFDAPSPFGPQGRRSRSNVPAQSLTMMNDPFVIDQAKQWARKLSSNGMDDKQRLTLMVQTAHGVDPSEEQIAALLAFMNSQASMYQESDDRVWSDVAHALFNMKAFYFVQ